MSPLNPRIENCLNFDIFDSFPLPICTLLTTINSECRRNYCFFFFTAPKADIFFSYPFSFPPLTMSPSLSVVCIANTGPLCARLTTLASLWPSHTNTSPFMAPVNVKFSCENSKYMCTCMCEGIDFNKTLESRTCIIPREIIATFIWMTFQQE